MNSIAEFEGALRSWEDFAWYQQQLLRCVGDAECVGAPANYSGFRRFLLGIRKRRELIEKEGLLRLLNPFNYLAEMRVPQVIALQPFTFSSWSLYRRAYQLGGEVIEQLKQPVLGFTWSSLPLPFDSFAVVLEEPISFPHSDVRTFAFLKTIVDGEPVVVMQLFPLANSRYERLARKPKLKVEQAAARGDAEYVVRAMEMQGRRIGGAASGAVSVLRSDAAIDAQPEGCDDEVAANAVRLCTRIVVNLCLYLHAMSVSGSRESNWVASANPGALDEQAIFIPQEVFRIRQRFHVKRAVIENSPPSVVTGRSVNWHFRREHFRRPAGSPLDAPKTIKVKEAEIRKDRAPEEGLPGGSTGSASG